MFYLNTDLKEQEYPQFALEAFLAFKEDTYDIFDSYFLQNLTKLKEKGSYMISNDFYRPDLISNNIYGDVQYWWLLMEYNGFLSEKELKIGRNVKYFDLQDLYNLYYKCINKNNTNNTNKHKI